MAKQMYDTPNLDELEKGRWPSFVTGLKRLAKDNDMMVDLLGQLETSYKTRAGYWKGGTVGVIGYGGGIIPRFTELKNADGTPKFPESAEFHTLRVQPPAGMHYSTELLRKLCDIWQKHGSGLIALHGQSGDIMFQGCSTENVQPAFDDLNAIGFDLGGAGAAMRGGRWKLTRATTRTQGEALDLYGRLRAAGYPALVYPGLAHGKLGVTDPKVSK